MGPLKVSGRFLQAAYVDYRGAWASCLAALRPGHDYRPALDEIALLGFGGVRVFCGALPWCGQTLEHVYAWLPDFLTETKARGLYAYLAYHTEAGTGYDLNAHTDRLDDIVDRHLHVLREVGNEPDHPSQGGRLSAAACRELASRMARPVGYGATIVDDESSEYAGGDFVPWHRDRGRPKWNQVRRQREGEALSAATGKPVLDQEGIGAAEVSVGGRRESDPAIFFTQAALARLFELSVSVFHSEDGLWARPLGPNQRACAEAFLRGSRLWPHDERLSYRNTGHGGSPVVSATFNDGENKPGVTRAYSGIAGDRGLLIVLGIVGDWRQHVQFGNGWRALDITMAEYPGVVAVEVRRG